LSPNNHTFSAKGTDVQKAKKNKNPESKTRKKMALGKGLGALISGMEPVEDGPDAYFECDISAIQPNRYQPRIRFSEEELRELSKSIKTQGIIQPILVRKADHGYEVVAGERRLRAARMAGLTRVPVVKRDLNDAEMLEMSIVENIQRENLNPMEEADAYHHLMDKFSLTQEGAAERVGKSRSAVANLLRLRNLPPPIKAHIMDGTLTMGHARALLGTETSAIQTAAWKRVVSKNLSVRETEALIKQMNSERIATPKKARVLDNSYFSDLSDELSRQFGTRVQIKRRGKRGKVEIEFYDNDDLTRLVDLLQKPG
jgi:ParB family transcriptional regulator, chromosome partitioning protein